MRININVTITGSIKEQLYPLILILYLYTCFYFVCVHSFLQVPIHMYQSAIWWHWCHIDVSDLPLLTYTLLHEKGNYVFRLSWHMLRQPPSCWDSELSTIWGTDSSCYVEAQRKKLDRSILRSLLSHIIAQFHVKAVVLMLETQYLLG